MGPRHNGIPLRQLILSLEVSRKVKVVDVRRGTRGIVLIAKTRASQPKYIAYKTTIEVLEENKLDAFVREARRMFSASGHPLVVTPYYITKMLGRPLICMRYMEMSLRVSPHAWKIG